jgi:hypothetical protein
MASRERRIEMTESDNEAGADPNKAPPHGLVRYDAMCRAIDAAYEVDELKMIHDQAAMLEAAARVAKNTDAEMRAYEIRMRAAKKASKVYDGGEKARAGRPSKNSPDERGDSSRPKTLNELGISSQEMSEWRKLNTLSDEEFEEGLKTKTLSEKTARVIPVSDKALLFIGTMRDFNRRGYLAGAPEEFMETMTEDMRAEVYHIAPQAAKWLSRLDGSQSALAAAPGPVSRVQIESAMRDIERLESQFHDHPRLCELLRTARGELRRIAIQANATPLNAAE